jgi:hypothetical protein
MDDELFLELLVSVHEGKAWLANTTPEERAALLNHANQLLIAYHKVLEFLDISPKGTVLSGYEDSDRIYCVMSNGDGTADIAKARDDGGSWFTSWNEVARIKNIEENLACEQFARLFDDDREDHCDWDELFDELTGETQEEQALEPEKLDCPTCGCPDDSTQIQDHGCCHDCHHEWQFGRLCLICYARMDKDGILTHAEGCAANQPEPTVLHVRADGSGHFTTITEAIAYINAQTETRGDYIITVLGRAIYEGITLPEHTMIIGVDEH